MNAERTLWQAYRDGSQFFMGRGDVYETLRRLARRLSDEELDYALIGGMALVAHGYRRFTERRGHSHDARSAPSLSRALRG